MRIVKALAGLVTVGWMAGGSVALAEKGTAEQREACTPDAFRLCVTSMPDADAVEQCLRAAGPRLSPACYAVFNPPQPAQPDIRANRPLPPAVGNAYAKQPDSAPRSNRIKPAAAPAPQVVAPPASDDDD